ncbi:hypothetical protein [Actinoplanes sp. NPDC051494]|uniref:hypothetical protein n=1 Tax=Actinoplanes sp. NPDC051494 TaxID=3363907 RepID=UPI0037BD781C
MAVTGHPGWGFRVSAEEVVVGAVVVQEGRWGDGERAVAVLGLIPVDFYPAHVVDVDRDGEDVADQGPFRHRDAGVAHGDLGVRQAWGHDQDLEFGTAVEGREGAF